MHSGSLVLAFVVGLAVVVAVVWRWSQRKSPNIFQASAVAVDSAKPEQSKPLFDIPEQHYDAIVVGSGIGGLAAAAVLSKAGKRVLVLEKLGKAGGCFHTFGGGSGVEFDTGVHCVGDMGPNDFSSFVLNTLSGTKIEWQLVPTPSDLVVFGDPSSKPIGRTLTVEGWTNTLMTHFPEEVDNIIHFMNTCTGIDKPVKGGLLRVGLVLRLMPLWLAKIVWKIGIMGTRQLAHATAMTATHVIAKATQNPHLRSLLAFPCVYKGAATSNTALSMYNVVTFVATNGQWWYPIGGSSVVPKAMVPAVFRAGGAVVVRKRVTRINVVRGKVVGVSVINVKPAQDEREQEISAPIVISDAGYANTCALLTPESIPMEWRELANGPRKLQHSCGVCMLFIALNATAEELGVTAQQSHWFASDKAIMEDFKARPLPPAPASPDHEDPNIIDVMFITSPSAKDPSWQQRHPNTCTLCAISPTPSAWFDKWKDTKKPGARGREYEELKGRISLAMWRVVKRMFPGIAKAQEAVVAKEEEAKTEVAGEKVKAAKKQSAHGETGLPATGYCGWETREQRGKVRWLCGATPLTLHHFLGAAEGSMVGLEANPNREHPETAMRLRFQTSVKGLFFAGQDSMTAGVKGALVSGIIAGGLAAGVPALQQLMEMHAEFQKRAKEQQHIASGKERTKKAE